MIGKIAVCVAVCLIGQAVSFPSNPVQDDSKTQGSDIGKYLLETYVKPLFNAGVKFERRTAKNISSSSSGKEPNTENKRLEIATTLDKMIVEDPFFTNKPLFETNLDSSKTHKSIIGRTSTSGDKVSKDHRVEFKKHPMESQLDTLLADDPFLMNEAKASVEKQPILNGSKTPRPTIELSHDGKVSKVNRAENQKRPTESSTLDAIFVEDPFEPKNAKERYERLPIFNISKTFRSMVEAAFSSGNQKKAGKEQLNKTSVANFSSTSDLFKSVLEDINKNLSSSIHVNGPYEKNGTTKFEVSGFAAIPITDGQQIDITNMTEVIKDSVLAMFSKATGNMNPDLLNGSVALIAASSNGMDPKIIKAETKTFSNEQLKKKMANEKPMIPSMQKSKGNDNPLHEIVDKSLVMLEKLFNEQKIQEHAKGAAELSSLKSLTDAFEEGVVGHGAIMLGASELPDSKSLTDAFEKGVLGHEAIMLHALNGNNINEFAKKYYSSFAGQPIHAGQPKQTVRDFGKLRKDQEKKTEGPYVREVVPDDLEEF